MGHFADIVWRTLLRATAGRQTVLHPRRQWAVSIALATVFVVLGWSALPRDIVTSGSPILLRDSVATANIGLPVLMLLDDGSAVRFGDAAVEPNGVIQVGVYDPLDPRLGHATEAVSLPGDPRLLWLLASDTERDAMREAAANLVHAMPHAIFDMFQSPEFVNNYRNGLTQRIHDDLQAAWQQTQESGAWQRLLHGYEPVLRDIASRDLRPIIESHFHGVPMRMLRANALMLIDPFGPPQWDLAPVEDALQAALTEVQQRSVPERAVARLMQNPATTDFLSHYLDAAMSQMAHDTELRNLLSEMILDDRFRSYLTPVSDRVMDVARIVPRLLVSLHGSADLNPVASYVIRDMATGQFDRIVILLSPAQRDELMQLDSDAVHPLVRVAGSA